MQGVFGRWAGDPVYLVGDYDSSKLYHKARNEYTNISQEVGVTVSDFLEGVHGEWKIKVCSSCRESKKEKTR